MCRAHGVAVVVPHDAPPLQGDALRLVYGKREPTLLVDAHAHRAHLRELLARPRLRGRALPFWAPHVEATGIAVPPSPLAECATCFLAPATHTRVWCPHGACASHVRAPCYHAAHRRNVVEALSNAHAFENEEDDEPVYCARADCQSVASALVACSECACTRYCSARCQGMDALDHLMTCRALTMTP